VGLPLDDVAAAGPTAAETQIVAPATAPAMGERGTRATGGEVWQEPPAQAVIARGEQRHRGQCGTGEEGRRHEAAAELLHDGAEIGEAPAKPAMAFGNVDRRPAQPGE